MPKINFNSSANPEKLSLTIKGLLLALIPVAVWWGARLGLDITKVELVDLANQLVILVSATAVVFGLVRKIVFKFKKA